MKFKFSREVIISLILHTGVFCTSCRPILFLSDTSSVIPLPYGCYSLIVGKHATTTAATRSTATTAASHVSAATSATATEHVETTGGRLNECAVSGGAAGTRLRWRRLYFYLVTAWFRSGRHIIPKEVRCCYARIKNVLLCYSHLTHRLFLLRCVAQLTSSIRDVEKQ